MTIYAAVGPYDARWWPSPLPGANLSYTETLSNVQASGDTVASASLAIEPSGTGELHATSLSVSGYTLTAKLSGGQPGRVYRNLLTITGSSGAVWQMVVWLEVSAEAAIPPCPSPAPAPGFGTSITWTA